MATERWNVNVQVFQRAKNAILADIRKTIPGAGSIEITVEAHGGVEYFEQALQDSEVQEALRQKNLTARLRIIDPLNTVKNYILKGLSSLAANSETQPAVFQVLEQDVDLYYAALRLPEVRREIEHKNVEVVFQVIDKTGKVKPDIVIATIDDAANGRLNKWFQASS